MSPRVSVVVPVYNAMPYLTACVASLRGQTLRGMEFIFVDDSSTDGSLDALLTAAEEDPRVRVIALPQNGGVSAARNRGIEAATGDYIGFCDADDTTEPGMFEALLNACEQADADVSFCRVYKDRPGGTEDVPLGFSDGTRFDDAAIRDTLIPAMLNRESDTDALPLSGYSPRNLFAREAVGKRRFREDIRYAEDLLFIIECLLASRSAVAVDRAYYHYRFHAGSTTKRFSAAIPESFERSNAAIEALLVGNAECARRMAMRRRKMALDVVRNYSAPGTPLSFPQRVRAARAYMTREDVRVLYVDVRLTGLPRRVSLKYALMKYRLAGLSCLLYSTIFRTRA